MNKEKKFMGLDVCKDRVVAWILSTRPTHLKNFFKEEAKNRSKNPLEDPFTFYYNNGGMSELVKLAPDVVILEPTGIHYSTLPFIVAQHHKIEVLWVGHKEIANYRKSQKLPDKNDLADAFALACYGLEHYGKKDYFISYPAKDIDKIRKLYFELKFSDKVTSGLIARLKQQLSFEFPEAMNSSIRKQRDGRSPLICWLAERQRYKTNGATAWQRKHDQSVSQKYGISISPFTKQLASFIDDQFLMQKERSEDLKKKVFAPEFEKYNQVFDDFCFDLNLRALLLVLIYPIENYPTKGQFKSKLGCAKVEESSGSSVSWKTGNGSAMCRAQLYIWCISRVVHKYQRKNTFTFNSVAGKEVQAFYDKWLHIINTDKDWIDNYTNKQLLNKASRALERTLKKELGEVLRKESNPVIQALIAAVQASFTQEMVSNSQDKEIKKNKTQVKNNLNQLIIGKTIGFAVGKLYRELKYFR